MIAQSCPSLPRPIPPSAMASDGQGLRSINLHQGGIFSKITEMEGVPISPDRTPYAAGVDTLNHPMFVT